MTDDEPLARTSLGTLLGAREDGLLRFRGVPYATAPTGAGRFAAPRPLQPWSGTKGARSDGAICPQAPSRLRHVLGDVDRAQSEDCLTLTITTPGLTGAQRPVLVWLHGGAYVSGAGSLAWYDGAELARAAGAVVVGVNYRLGPLGFLCSPGLADGTAGLLDIVAALTWVQAHIASFGGGPERVTVAGQSAGAHAIMALLAMPETRGLFQRAILQSAPAGVAPLSTAVAAERGARFATLLGEGPAISHVEAARVRTAPVDRLLQAAGKLARESARFGEVAPPFLPVLDDLADPARFVQAAATGATGKEVIVGTTRDEAHAFFAGPQSHDLDLSTLGAFLSARTGRTDALATYQQRRPGARPVDLLADWVTERTFLAPSLQLADAAARAGAKVWMYRFDWAPPVSPFGACHGIELPFVFGTLNAWREAPMLRGGESQTMSDLSRTVRESWAAFVRQGNPAGSGLDWPRYQPDRRQTMVVGEIVSAVGDPSAVVSPPGRTN